MPQHGPHAQGIAQVQKTEPPQGYPPQASVPQPRRHDHNDNVIISKVNSGPRRNVNVSASNNIVQEYSNTLPTEADNNADKHYFSKNFVTFEWVDLVCTVTLFLSLYKTQEDIIICSGATAVTLHTGETIVLRFGQGHWLRERMDKALINSN